MYTRKNTNKNVKFSFVFSSGKYILTALIADICLRGNDLFILPR